jgi:flagellum-specific peptidoglycan hydrolase FlgJ
MDLYQTQFLTKASEQAEQAGHIFPDMAACEAAEESGYGTSALAIEGNNLFGTHQHVFMPVFETIVLPSKEYVNGQYVQSPARWVKYPNLAACFTDRMDTLTRLARSFPHYAAALCATNAYTYVGEVSQTWSTDPRRADNCIKIYREWKGLDSDD